MRLDLTSVFQGIVRRGELAACLASLVVLVSPALSDAHHRAVSMPRAPFVRPLPFTVAAATRRLDGQSPVTFSPDNRWIAFVYYIAPKRPTGRVSWDYSDTGVPSPAQGIPRLQLLRLSDRKSKELSDNEISTWAPSWSPDGMRLAYYSNRGGAAGLWIWNRNTERSRKVPGVVPRPHDFAVDIPVWIDADHILLKIVPSTMTLVQANTLDARSQTSQATRTGTRLYQSRLSNVLPSKFDEVTSSGWLNAWLSDLVVTDIKSGERRTLSTRTRISLYRVSPNLRSVVYSKIIAFNPANDTIRFKLLGTSISGATRPQVVAPNLQTSQGLLSLNWAPDSHRIAYLDTSDRGRQRIAIADLDGRNVSYTLPAPSQSVASSKNSNAQVHGVSAPIWTQDSKSVLAIVNGSPRRWNLVTSQVTSFLGTPAVTLLRFVTHNDSTAARASPGGGYLFLSQVAVGSGEAIVKLDQSGKIVSGTPASSKSAILASSVVLGPNGIVAYVAEDQNHLPDIWFFNSKSGEREQITRINPELDQYALGDVRHIVWKTKSGQQLSGLVALPPTWRSGLRPPVFVWVYGGTTLLNRQDRYSFGWGDSGPEYDIHVLTTRGYAVFFPEMPYRSGSQSSDFLAAVIPGVTALVNAGYGDPDRLTIGGQSFGSYTVWTLLGQTNIFKAAITSGNVYHPDLTAAYTQAPSPAEGKIYTAAFENGQTKLGGPPWTVPNRFYDNSPIFSLDKWTTPILMAESDEDGTIGTWAADAMFVALQRLGKYADYVVYRNEPHSIVSRDNVIDFWRRRVLFLASFTPVKSRDLHRTH